MTELKQSTNLIILDLDDVVTFLDKDEIVLLKNMFYKMEMGRVLTGKTKEQYIITNVKEPYIEEVKKAINSGEIVKNNLSKETTKRLQ